MSKERALKAIRDCIKKHTDEHPVQKVMMDELISFLKEEEVIDYKGIGVLKTIQANRNGIHSYQERENGTWSKLKECTEFWSLLMQEISKDVIPRTEAKN